ncbi:MAG: hypothetical protein QGD94_08965 [Planctomycetia bacterium]|nr:hypothetical protein [Planctomycetia bacterium]
MHDLYDKAKVTNGDGNFEETDGAALLATYQYDGTNRRVAKNSSAQTPGTPAGPAAVASTLLAEREWRVCTHSMHEDFCFDAPATP